MTRWVEEIPTSAQIKHIYVLGSQWVNQASFGFSRLAVPIENATIDGQYPIKAGLRGLPAGEADSSFPEVSFVGPNAPAQWRGTDARAFTEYLNNFTLQNNLSWTHGRHTTTFGLQAQRMDADERERTYGSLATFGFSNVQTAGFSPTGTLDTASGNAYASYLLGELNATNVIEDSEVATSGRFYTYAFWAQDDFKLRPNLSLNLGLRYDIMKPYTELYDRWSFMDRDACRTRQSAAILARWCSRETARTAATAARQSRRTTAQLGPALGLAYTLNERTVLRTAYGINYSRRGAVGGRAGARNGTGMLGFSANASFPSPNASFAPAYNWNDGVPGYAASAVFRSVAQHRLRDGPRNRRHRHLRRSRNRRADAAVSELECGVAVRAAEQYHRRRIVCGQPRRFPGRQRTRVLLEPDGPEVSRAWKSADAAGDAANHRGGTGDRAQASRFRIRTSQAPFRRCCVRFRSTRGSPTFTATSRESNYHSLQLTAEKRRSDDGLSVSFNYTFSRTEDNLSARTGYDFDQDWAVGVERSAARVERDRGVRPAVRQRKAGPAARNPFVRAIVKDWQVSGITQFRSGRPLGSIGATCNLPNAGTCYADFNPDFSGPVRINGDYGDGDVLGTNPPTLHRSSGVSVACPFHLRQHAEERSRTICEIRATSIRISAYAAISRLGGPSSGSASTCSTCSTTWCSAASRPTSRTPTSGASARRSNTPRVGQIKIRLEF